MKLLCACLLALLSSSHGFSAQRSLTTNRHVQQQQQQQSHATTVPKRDLVVLFMDDEDFDEEDFVDDDFMMGGGGGTATATTSSFGMGGSNNRIGMGEVPVMVVEAEASDFVAEATTVVQDTNNNDSNKIMADVEPSKMSIQELKDELDSWGVNYDDCFEKLDLVKRLYITRKSPGQQIGQHLRAEQAAKTEGVVVDKDKQVLQSFGYVGLTEEEYFAQQMETARSNSGQRGNVVEESASEHQTPTPRKSAANPMPSSTPKPDGGYTIPRSGRIFLEEPPTQPKSRSSRGGRRPDIQLEDTPFNNARSSNNERRSSNNDRRSIPTARGRSAPTILLEDLPGPDDKFPFSRNHTPKNKRSHSVESDMIQPNDPTSFGGTESQQPKARNVPTADGKGYVGLTEDEYFAQSAAGSSAGTHRVATPRRHKAVPFGMTEEEFLKQQKAMGIQNNHGDTTAPVPKINQPNSVSFGAGGSSLGGGIIPDELM